MGGAAGHMRHPFDLDVVSDGQGLIKIFEDLKSYTQTAAVDGIAPCPGCPFALNSE